MACSGLVSEATLNLLTQTCRSLYVPLYTSEKPPEEKRCSSMLRSRIKSTCDDGRRSRKVQAPRSFRWVHLKVKLAGDRKSSAYNAPSEFVTRADGKAVLYPDPRRQTPLERDHQTVGQKTGLMSCPTELVSGCDCTSRCAS